MMNYVGSISIIDRGDAPAQAVIDKNVRSLAQRVADETKDELDKVMDRVDNIYVSYEMSTQTMFENPRASPNVEYIEDIKELEEIIKDTVKKKKYQQQVTIFIVGFQDACSEKMQLLQQVNQFFLDNSKPDEEDLVEEKPEIDMDECASKINESLKTAEDLTKKLSDLNQDIIEWLVNWANTKASNKTPSAMLNYDKGKKRLEKSLETAKNDMTTLQEKLLNLQTELEEKDEKFQSLAKQLDAKTQEALRYKTAAEVAKKSAQDNESHTSTLQNEITVRDDKIKELRQKLTRMEINLTESQFDTELHQKRFNNKHSETQDEQQEIPNEEVEDEVITHGEVENEAVEVKVEHEAENETSWLALEDTKQEKQKLETLQEEVEAKKIAVVEAEREMDRLHHEQLKDLEQSHKQEIDELKAEHVAELTRLTDQIKSLHGQLSDAERHAQQAFDETDQLRATIIELQLGGSRRTTPTKERPKSRESSGKSYGGDQSAGEEEHPTSKQESRPSTKDTKSSKRSEVKAKIPSRSPNRVVKEKSGAKASGTKEYAEASIQDEEGDHLKAFVQKSNDNSRQPTRQSKNLQPVEEVNIDFQDVYELDDEESWASVPTAQVPGRFAQYRKLSAAKVKELQDQLNITLTKTHRKVNSLKSQFTEHKKKWESERKVLIEQVEQAQKLQTEAEKEADAAMTQLEEFINEQEKLEDEEETKRQEVLKAISRPGTVGPATPTIAEPTDAEQKKSEEAQNDDASGEEIIPAESSDQELKKLMQQTDDAKAQASRASGAISAPPAVEGEEAQIKSKIEHEPVVGKTEDEIRVSSAKSRASLRNQFKSRLEETRTVVEDRRAKSPAISIPSQKSLDDDQLIIDDDDDDLPIPDDMKVEDVKEDTLEAGTSPPPEAKPGQHVHTQVSRTTSKQSINLAEHPVVQEYLKTYRGVHNFKDTISRLLEDKDQMSASQILADIDTVPFDQSTKVQPQLENMTDNVYYVLNEVSQVINSIIHNDRGPVVSSLMMGMSRDPTQRSMIKERSSESVDLRQGSQKSVKVGPSPGVDRQQFKDLQDKYETLKIAYIRQGQMSEDAKKYEEQLRHNQVVMMEMQDTITELQRELSALGKTPRRPMSDSVSTPGGGSQNAESAVMFTRLDSERNAKIMKKAVVDEKLDPGSYKEAMVQMDEYVNLPAQRLNHLVRKYVHHCRMKDIEENVKKSKSLNENVFNILDKMEELQNQRAKRWADRMDEMGMERLRIASQLMETLDTIETQSGIFLIKPMYSYRGREPKEHYSGKISRPFRPTRALSPLRDVQSAYAPAPTPASNMRAVVRAQGKQQEPPQISQEQPPASVRAEPPRPLEGDSQGLMGSSVNWVGTQPKATWSMSDSQPRVDGSLMMANLNTPRILELDINRMMIGQNTISAQIGSQGVSNDRLVNASNSNLRSYMTVNRPAVGPGGSAKGERPLSGNRQQDSPAPPSSPVVVSSSKGVRIPNDQFSSTPPLPPIGTGTLQGRVTPKGSKGRQSPRDSSRSPPGSSSSLRQTPPGTNIDVEIISTIK